MAALRVLKVPQSDDDKQFVLLQASSSGKKPLDLKLIGTEGEAPYVVKSRSSLLSPNPKSLHLKLTNPVSQSSMIVFLH